MRCYCILWYIIFIDLLKMRRPIHPICIILKSIPPFINGENSQISETPYRIFTATLRLDRLTHSTQAYTNERGANINVLSPGSWLNVGHRLSPQQGLNKERIWGGVKVNMTGKWKVRWKWEAGGGLSASIYSNYYLLTYCNATITLDDTTVYLIIVWGHKMY